MKFILIFLVIASPLSNAASVNLLINPGAETGNLSGWDTFGLVTPLVASPATIPPEHDSGFSPYDGQFYFVGGRNGGGSIAQNVYFTGYEAAINTGDSFLTAGFWEASLDQGEQTDTARMIVSFFDVSNNIIGQFSSPAVAFKNSSQPAVTNYGNYETTISIPKFAVAANYEITFIHNSGFESDLDAYVDQTYLSVTAVPELSSSALSALGGLSILLLPRRRNRL